MNTRAKPRRTVITRYQEVYPSEPLVRSSDVIRPRASDLINLEFFEAEAADMPIAQFSEHHILVNLRKTPMEVINWRNGEERKFIYACDEIVITPAGLESGWRWAERSKVIVITIIPAQLKRFATHELGQLLSAQQLKDVPQASDPDLCAAAAMLLDALALRGNGSEVMYESLARVFTVKLLGRYGEDAAQEAQFSKAFTANHYKRVLDHVADNFGNAVAIADLAFAAGLSQAHFSRQFRRTIGDSPHQFLMRYRVEQASAMLRDKSRALSEIAFTCGFSDQAHLTRLFKRYLGSTPRQYRSNI